MEWRLMLARAKPSIYLFVFLILFHLTVCHQTKTPCFHMKTPGFTHPHGDIIIESGGTLTINCSIYEEYMRKSNITSDDLYFVRNNETLSKDWIRKINDTTIQLTIENMPPSTNMYTCMTPGQAVCLNFVIVDTKPTDVLNFSCISLNYENLTCRWIAPEHYVKTTYNLSYYFPGRNNRAIYVCPNVTNKNNEYSCFWDITTNPHYRQVQPTYYFNLNISNAFGGHSQKFVLSHFANVIPEPPDNLKVVNKTYNSVTLSWSVRSPMKSFPPHVVHRLVYQSEFDHKDVWHVANTSIIDKNDTPVYKLSGLQYAHVLYDIRVSMRSSKAREDDLKMWSKNVSLTVRTESTVPGAPPEVNIGSFEIVNNRTRRDIYVYWKSIPEHLKNGENFSYKIIELDNNIEPSDITNTYARFENLSQNTHKFQVISTNEIGNSVNSSYLEVPSLNERLPEPTLFTKISYGEQVYELSWNPPKTEKLIESYTIFYCRNDYDRPFQCKGYLQWVEVDGNTTMQNITVPEDRVYQFAISANSIQTSSGMVWASCTVIHDKEFTKMKKLWIDNIGSDFMEVGWKLDCSDRIGSIEGFIIYYCPIVSPVDITCYGEERNVTIRGEATSGRITNLKPYTTYMLTVSVKSKHNSKGLPSDPLYNTTLEGAPDPPQNITVSKVTSSSMFVSWSPPKSVNGLLRYYEVEYTHNRFTQEKKPLKEKDTFVELTNLSSFTEYKIVVYAYTAFKSKPSVAKHITTAISTPGKMRSPSIKFQNESTILVAWSAPDPTGGRLDIYQLCVKEQINFENRTKFFNTSELQLEVDNCGTDKALKVLYFSVRAINLDEMKREYVGEWSPETENYCQNPPHMLLWLFVGGGIVFVAAVAFFLKKAWYRCQMMRDVEVKLPPGLAPPITNDVGMTHWPNTQKSANDNNLNTLSRTDTSADEEHLLGKKAELGDHERIPSGDSSGCSSGHESVTSSLASGTNLSSTSDSGTEQPRTPNSDSISRENSLRQRKTGSEQNWEPELTWMQTDFTLTKPGKTAISPTNWATPKPPTSNYCVLGVDNIIQQPDAAVAAVVTTNSGYVPVPLTQQQQQQPQQQALPPPAQTTPAYVTCDTIFPKAEATSPAVVVVTPSAASAPAYVKTSDLNRLVIEPDPKTTTTPSYVMAGTRLPTTGKLINIEPTTTPIPQTTPSVVVGGAGGGYVKTEDILGLKGERSRRGSDEPTPTLNPYCRLGWDKTAGIVESASVPTTPTLKHPPETTTQPQQIKGYVPHRQFENKSLKED